MHELTGRRVVFFGGKGGVGKTTIASAFAIAASRRGRSCLIVSTDPAHSLGDAFDRRIGATETALLPGLSGMEIDPDAEARRHIERVKRNARLLVRPQLYAEVDRQLDLARHAPGASEAAMLEAVARVLIEALERFDLVVFDTAPTGHTIRLLSLPEAMAAWTDGLLRHHDRSRHLGGVLQRLGGRVAADELSYLRGEDEGDERDPMTRVRRVLMERRAVFARARRTLLDARTTAFVLVVTPEKLPILETRKAAEQLRRAHIPLAGIVLNRVLPATADGDFLATRRRQEAVHLREIEHSFSDLALHRVPLCERDIEGAEALGRIADRLMEAS
jgi:arsenite-transporting ATPase